MRIDDRVRRGLAERADAVRPTRSDWSAEWPTLRSLVDRTRRRRRRIVAVVVTLVGGVAGAVATVIAVL
jgi:hypothetical protein